VAKCSIWWRFLRRWRQQRSPEKDLGGPGNEAEGIFEEAESKSVLAVEGQKHGIFPNKKNLADHAQEMEISAREGQ
jgi:hypothetical protein